MYNICTCIYPFIFTGNGEIGLESLRNNSNKDIQLKNDELIASEWQKDVLDFDKITSGRIHPSQIITQGNDNHIHNDSIQIKNDGLIAMNIAKNQTVIDELTEGQMTNNDYYIKQ